MRRRPHRYASRTFGSRNAFWFRYGSGDHCRSIVVRSSGRSGLMPLRGSEYCKSLGEKREAVGVSLTWASMICRDFVGDAPTHCRASPSPKPVSTCKGFLMKSRSQSAISGEIRWVFLQRPAQAANKVPYFMGHFGDPDRSRVPQDKQHGSGKSAKPCGYSKSMP